MYSLDVIISMNNRPQRKSAVANRDCSYQASRKGYVLHSASARDTVFISGSAAITFKKFLSGSPSQKSINRKIESIYAKYQASL